MQSATTSRPPREASPPLARRASLVNAAPARECVQRWITRGFAVNRIAVAAGLAPASVHRVLCEESRLVGRETSAKLLALTHEELVESSHSKQTPIDNVRPKVLEWIELGFTSRAIAVCVGVTPAAMANLVAGTVQRCETSTAKAIMAMSERDLYRLAGPDLPVPMGPLRGRIDFLLASGFSTRLFATASGLSSSVMHNLANPERTSCAASSYRALVDITYRDLFAAASGLTHVPSYATRRRYEGLAAIGWRVSDIDDIAEKLKMRPMGRTIESACSAASVSAQTHHDFAALFGRVNRSAGPSDRARSLAIANDWIAPRLWEDIDDPAETPLPDWAEAAA